MLWSDSDSYCNPFAESLSVSFFILKGENVESGKDQSTPKRGQNDGKSLGELIDDFPEGLQCKHKLEVTVFMWMREFGIVTSKTDDVAKGEIWFRKWFPFCRLGGPPLPFNYWPERPGRGRKVVLQTKDRLIIHENNVSTNQAYAETERLAQIGRDIFLM